MPTVPFVPKQEIWLVPAFLGSGELGQQLSGAGSSRLSRADTTNDPYLKAEEIGAELQRTLRELQAESFTKLAHDASLQRRAAQMAASITITCSWHPYIDGFPYLDENTNVEFNRLGHFQFEVEYFADAPEQRASIDPILVQQLPAKALPVLHTISNRTTNRWLHLDTDSPIFVFVITDDAGPNPPPWSLDNIRAHKRAIGSWTEVYSGAWHDYAEDLYDRRIQGNLSNRLSEIHLIRKNSGFIYMAPDNMARYFEGYMRAYVIAPTAELRSMHFALMSVSNSLDILMMRQAREELDDVAVIEAKLRGLRLLRSCLQMKMTEIYNELDRHRRQHYSAVIGHLLEEFNLTQGGLFGRVDKKFETLHEGMINLYQRQEARNQDKTERRLRLLNTLFGLMALGELSDLSLGMVQGGRTGDLVALAVNGVLSAVVAVVAIALIIREVRARGEQTTTRHESFLALVFDGEGRVLVVTREEAPYRGQRSFPCTEPIATSELAGANEAEFVEREIKYQTNLSVKNMTKLGPTFAREDRDPRGRIVAHAYTCEASNPDELECRGDLGDGRFVPLETLHNEELAFDHEDVVDHLLERA